MGYRKSRFQTAENGYTYTIDDEVVEGNIWVTFSKHITGGWSIMTTHLKGFNYHLYMMNDKKWHELQCNDRIPLHEYVNKDGSISDQYLFLAIAKGISKYVKLNATHRAICEAVLTMRIENR